jgi:prepilin-type N-terminal cleavage/methylation domain-containing protein
MARRSLKARGRNGFTLIEALVVVLIIGIMVRISFPQLYKLIEKNKTSEAVDLFLALKGAQDRYSSKYGTFCNAAITACPGFDTTPPVLRYFNAVPAFTGAGTSWQLKLTRTNAPEIYGSYQLTYDVEPGAAPLLTCSQSNCTTDLLPSP